MNDEINLEEIIFLRKEYATKSLRVAPVAEHVTLVHELFADKVDDPWFQICIQFLSEHRDAIVLRGELPDNVAFLYFPIANKGIWYRIQGKVKAMGPSAIATDECVGMRTHNPTLHLC